MGFKPSRADPDTWMKYCKDGSHYEYIAVYIDDLAIYMEDPKSFCDKLREVAPVRELDLAMCVSPSLNGSKMRSPWTNLMKS